MYLVLLRTKTRYTSIVFYQETFFENINVHYIDLAIYYLHLDIEIIQ